MAFLIGFGLMDGTDKARLTFIFCVSGIAKVPASVCAS